ncbi:MAG: type II toxin-antitoxin system VapB family antitoxin [Rhodospirillales bacterium]|nr:type II toxin-antitoxin system VapB family antitoxin [Rhodospirillales bacterium]
MRTTLDINDELLRAAKAHAATRRTTLTATVEQALRAFLAGPAHAPSDPPLIPVFCGRGVQTGVDLTDNAALEDMMDAGP